jgi:hypothetical protein
MQILEFDQFEFANPSTEERLRLSVERKSQLPLASEFLDHCLSRVQRSSLLPPVPVAAFQECLWRQEVEALLSRFAPHLAQELGESKVRTLLIEPDQHWLLIESSERFILYEWSTSA